MRNTLALLAATESRSRRKVSTPEGAVLPDTASIPRWARAIWGGTLILLNLFMLVYVVGFASMVVSAFGPFGGRDFAGSFFNDEQAFLGLFSVVAFAVLLSFAFMGLSLLHILRWSDLSNDRKLIWAIAVFAGAQPAALVYWYVHVWRRDPLGARPPAAIADTPGRRAWLLLLGAVTLIPPLYFVAFMLVVAGGIAGADDGGGMNSLLGWLPIAHLSVIVLWWVLTGIYLVDVFRTPRLEGTARALWAVIIAFGGPIGWPIYWYMNMWRPAPDATVGTLAPVSSAPDAVSEQER